MEGRLYAHFTIIFDVEAPLESHNGLACERVLTSVVERERP